MTSLRIDGHQDALHYCQPRPTDTWAMMLSNILQLPSHTHLHNPAVLYLCSYLFVLCCSWQCLVR